MLWGFHLCVVGFWCVHILALMWVSRIWQRKKFQRRSLGKNTPKAVCGFKKDSLPSGSLMRSSSYQPQTGVKTNTSFKSNRLAKQQKKIMSDDHTGKVRLFMQSHLWPQKYCSAVATDEYNQSSQECSAGSTYEMWPLLSQTPPTAMCL